MAYPHDGYLPGFTVIDNPYVSTSNYATNGPARIMWHMTVSSNISASYIAGHSVPPQLWANPYNGERYQTGSLLKPGKALYQPQFGNSWTNRHGYTIQIELVGVPVVNQKTYSDSQDKWIGEYVQAPIIKWFRDMGIPYDENAVKRCYNSSGSASEYWPGRMSDAESSATGGVVGHIWEWGNDHWDPSVENTEAWLAYAKAFLGGGPKPPPVKLGEEVPMKKLISDKAQSGTGTLYVLDYQGNCWAIREDTTRVVLEELQILEKTPPMKVHPNTFNILHMCGIWEDNPDKPVV